jgi:WD40 repeat protein
MAAVGLDNNTALVFDPSGSSQQTTLNGHDGLVRAVAFSKDGSLLATGARDSTLILWKGTSLIKKKQAGVAYPRPCI